MLTEAGWDLVANLECTRVVGRVDQVEPANLGGQIPIARRWVDYRVLREVVEHGENRGRMGLEVRMVNLVHQTVRST